MDITDRLVRNVIETAYEDLPENVIETTKLAILDTMGCVIAGSSSPGILALREQVVDWGGKKESAVLVHGGERVPCPNAALVNSTMARALDFDPTWARGIHMSAASVPTALAVAEMRQGVSGKEFLTAIAAGEDLAARIAFATPNYGGFEPTGVCGILGLAAITGKLLGFDQRQMLEALAIAFNRGAGSYQPNVDGALMIRVLEGLASRSGIESALLARRGISGGEDTLEGTYGFFHLFCKDRYDKEILTGGLGKTFVGASETFFKRYPSCGGTGSAIDATLELAKETGVRPEDVAEIIVDAAPFFHTFLGNPFKMGANPQGSAQFSYQYTVACALVRKRFELQDILPERIDDPEILGVAEKVHSRVNADSAIESGATTVRIVTKQGREYVRKVENRKGSKQDPFCREEIIQKFLHCANFSRVPFAEGTPEQIIRIVDELERISDMTELVRLMVV